MTGYYNTFVVKIWRDEAEGTFRGYIQHVRSQERIYFLNLEDMNNFIKKHLQPPPGVSIAQDETQGKRAKVAEDFGDVS